jgi:diaminohydroxyphosphoribosylaminopyrimidine deaminase/5-amino-6-(5-phosphoribosylamino)uracil reductase
MSAINDQTHLRQAIRLAMNGRGQVEPNPMVGCVIVKDGRVIGRGFHARFGGPHAEPAAIQSCTESPAGATAYVTLEPCCHTNKKTPPCAPLLIREKIARVVIGCLDPNPLVNGNGVRMLREAGVDVEGPVLEAECRQLIAPFLLRVRPTAGPRLRPTVVGQATHLAPGDPPGESGKSPGGSPGAKWDTSGNSKPYLTLKWAQSSDGKIAGPGGARVQISNARSSRAVQELRGRCNGIAVGIGTVLNDNPTLLPRGVPVPAVYDRMVLDTHLRMPIDSELVATAKKSPVTVFTAGGNGCAKQISALEQSGVKVVTGLPVDAAGRLSLPSWIGSLNKGTYTHILVEPGPTLAASMLPITDRLWIIRSPNPINDPTAPAAAAVPSYFVPTGEIDLDGDRLTEYLNTRGDVFFTAAVSADLVLADASLG